MRSRDNLLQASPFATHFDVEEAEGYLLLKHKTLLALELAASSGLGISVWNFSLASHRLYPFCCNC
jgi:hypothetical protein